MREGRSGDVIVKRRSDVGVILAIQRAESEGLVRLVCSYGGLNGTWGVICVIDISTFNHEESLLGS